MAVKRSPPPTARSTGQKALLIDSTSDLARPLVDPRGPRLFIAGRLRSLLFVCTLDFKVPIEIYELFHVCFQLAFERRPAYKARVIKNRELFDGQTICKATCVDIHRCQNVADAGSEEDTCRRRRQNLASG